MSGPPEALLGSSEHRPAWFGFDLGSAPSVSVELPWSSRPLGERLRLRREEDERIWTRFAPIAGAPEAPKHLLPPGFELKRLPAGLPAGLVEGLVEGLRARHRPELPLLERLRVLVGVYRHVSKTRPWWLVALACLACLPAVLRGEDLHVVAARRSA